MIRTGGDAFDPADRFRYFLASGVGRLDVTRPLHDHFLLAVSEIGQSEDQHRAIERWLADGVKVLIDSGVFTYVSEHARKFGISFYEALQVPPEEIDGWAKLWAAYLDTIRRYGDRSWGYIELDQGGQEQKAITRAKLEALGLRPIPVYHPLTDDPAYFDFLATHYDRICVANVVQSPLPIRLRLLATLQERRRRYPHLWVHVLGYTPDQHFYAMPADSGDSSSWLSGIRWANGMVDKAAGVRRFRLPRQFFYDRESASGSEGGADSGVRFGAYMAVFNERNWRRYAGDVAALGPIGGGL